MRTLTKLAWGLWGLTLLVVVVVMTYIDDIFTVVGL